MTSKVLTLGVGALVAFASISAAQAQTAAPAAPAAPPINHGPPIAGLCTISVDQAIGTSVVGKFVGTRMDQIVAQVRAELSPEETALTTEQRAIEQARTTTDPVALQSRQANFNLRATNYQRKADQRQRELQATEQKAIQRIGQELDPVVRQVYQTSHCSILISRDAVIGNLANPAMDITGAAVVALNARIQQFQFDREHLDAAAPGAAPAAPQR